MVFIVRTRRDAKGQLRGVITHAGSGRREAFGDTSEIGRLIQQMSIERDAAPAGIAQLDVPRKGKPA